MDPTIAIPLAKVAWNVAKGILGVELEERLGALSPDVRAALESISDATAEALIASEILEELQEAANDPARASKVAKIRERIAARKGAKGDN